MKGFHLLGGSAALSALLIFAAAEADAQQRPAGSGPRNPIASGGGQTGSGGQVVGVGKVGDGGHRGRGHWGAGDVWIVEDDVVEVVQVEKEAGPADAAAAAAAAPAAKEAPPEPEPRKPYAVGNSYATLPPGCMKLIQDGATYYHCSGEWYQGSAGHYVAVPAP